MVEQLTGSAVGAGAPVLVTFTADVNSKVVPMQLVS